jgi:FkbM family methyltransferase
LLGRLGAERVPGYAVMVQRFRDLAFPELEGNDGFVPVTVEGIVLEVPEDELSYYLHRRPEPLTTKAFRACLRPGSVVVDVGANIGYYSCLGGKLIGPGGTVHSFEPAAENVEILRRNITRNGLRNVRVHEVAAAAESGKRTLRIAGVSGHHSFYAHPMSETVRTVTVDTRPVDALVEGPVSVIKIDVEGAELEVVHGMRELLRSSPGGDTVRRMESREPAVVRP